MAKLLIRLACGAVGAFLFAGGKGARMSGIRLDSPPNYWVGTGLQLLGSALLWFCFVRWKRSRLDGPHAQSKWMNPSRLGSLYLVIGGVFIASLVMLIAATASEAVGGVASAIVATPDSLVKLTLAIVTIGVGASLVARSGNTGPLLTIAAILLTLIWPLGVALSAWTAWTILGARSTVVSNVAAQYSKPTDA